MKMELFKKISLTAAISAMPLLSCAADANNTAWQFDIAPYLWAANLNGRVGIGPVTAHVSEDFATILSQLNVGGMLWLGAHKGPFGLFLNSMYIVLSDDATFGPINVSEKTYSGLFTAGISYIVLQKQFSYKNGSTSQLQLEPYLGDRYTMNKVRVNVGPYTVSDNQHWHDPVIGLRVTYDWMPHWILQVAGDLGGTNASSHYSYNLVGLVGYKPTNHSLKNTTFYLGYRDLYQVYKTGSGLQLFDWNMRQFGPLLGVNFSI